MYALRYLAGSHLPPFKKLHFNLQKVVPGVEKKSYCLILEPKDYLTIT